MLLITNKINTLFHLVQEEAAKSHQRQLQERQANMVISEVSQHESPVRQDLILVSDDESSDDESIVSGTDVESDEDDESVESITESGDSDL